MIRDIQKKVLADFSGGRVTSENQATIPENCLLVARNVLVHSGAPQPIPGYKLVQQLDLTKVQRLFHYERQSDKTKYLVATGKNAGGKASVIIGSLDGVMVPETLSSTEDDGDYDFIPTAHTLYMNNKIAPKKLVNIGGVETLVPWGLKPPIAAPSIDIGNGVLTLTYGRRYVYCEVFRWTDSEGVQRFHVSAPSDFSAHTGAIANKAVTLANFVKRNAHTTHFWIFCTEDSEIDASDFYAFAGEIPASQASWVDQLADEDLDMTREAPWDNYPPPENADVLIEVNGRAVFMHDDVVQFSALNEISLGQPMECFPENLKFRVPGGVKSLTGATKFKIGDAETLMLSNVDEWFQVAGSSEQSFQKRDKVISPGAVGRKCILQIHGRLVYLAKDKKLWAWNGVIGEEPVPASVAIHANGDDQLSMNDLDTDALAECELQWYSNGTFDFAVLVAASSSSESGEKDWIQVWDLSPIVGVKTIQGPLPNPVLTDFFPADKFSTSLVARDAGVPYIYFGDFEDGSVYRWPDGSDFNGSVIDPLIGTPWIRVAAAKVRMFWTRLMTSVDNAYQNFGFLAQVGHGTSRTVNPTVVELALAPDDENPDTTVAKAIHNEPGTEFGEFVKVFVRLPDTPATLDAVEIAYKPVGRT